MTTIEWTNLTRNFIYGCSHAGSPGCDNCYAARMAHRQVAMGNYPQGITEKGPNGARWTGKVVVDYDKMKSAFTSLPKRASKKVFLCSMSDLFHPDVPFEFISRVYTGIQVCKRHTFQILTKRPERMLEWYAWEEDQQMDNAWLDWFPNLWLGVTVENQDNAWRIGKLLQIPATVRFVSYEPALDTLDLRSCLICPRCGGYDPDCKCGGGLDWLIAGGETGPRARPADPDWFRSVRDQCQAAKVPFFFKGRGGARKVYATPLGNVQVNRRLLDGKEWNEFPLDTHPKK